MEEQLIKYMEESLKNLPQQKYLKTELRKVIESYIPIDLINIIISYFEKCNKCEQAIQNSNKCNCKDPLKNTWCAYCYGVYIANRRCNNCIDINIPKKILVHTHPKCIVEECNNYACFGTVERMLYCMPHSKYSILIYYAYICNHYECVNYGIYHGTTYSCKLHKKDSDTLYFMEGSKSKFPHLTKCDECNKKCSITRTCKCGIIRCIDCATLDTFRIEDQKNNTTRYCYKCAEKSDMNWYQYEFNVCNADNCNIGAEVYDCHTLKFLCKNHSNKNTCVSVGEKCKKIVCCAMRTINSNFCRHHAI